MPEVQTSSSTEEEGLPEEEQSTPGAQFFYYRIRFRQEAQEYSAQSSLADLHAADLVMVKTDHGPEPALVVSHAAGTGSTEMERRVSYVVQRRTTREEAERFERLPELEKEAFVCCERQIKSLHLPMNLVRVERFFNGSKIIFYFTAESRVDFRELVKNLVQEFRTRVEMRQIGVRHETQMMGGIGACGRELCCTSFLKKFESVSIKMAKTQDLPLNPAKISGVCNRLLCCLTYEYDSYRIMKNGMPRIGRTISYQGSMYKVIRLLPLLGNVLTISSDGEERVFSEKEWRAAEPVHKGPPPPRKTTKGAAKQGQPVPKKDKKKKN